MTRDLNLFRELLFEVEAAPAHEPLSYEGPTKDPEAAIRLEHFHLLMEAGYIQGIEISNTHGRVRMRGWTEMRVTNYGHDFLDSIRDESIWRETTEKIGKTVGTAALGIVKQVVTAIVMSRLGLS